jgi:hypothetical protein
VPRKKKSPNNFSKLVDKKIPLEELPIKTIKVTIHALRWIFLLVFLFLIIGTFILLATGAQQYFQMIVGFGITGFFTFFMGYFGWMFAQNVMEIMIGNMNKDPSSYYFRKRKFKS